MSVGVALLHSGHSQGDPITAISSVAVLADMLLFGWLVFRGGRQVTKAASMPAE
jgi:hypothetical protein